MPLSNMPVFKQCCGTGPSRDQAPSECQPGFSIIRWSVANDSRLRDSAHDPERPGEMVAERGCTWANSVHPGNSRIEKLSYRSRKLVGFGRLNRFCNTTRLRGSGWRQARVLTGRSGALAPLMAITDAGRPSAFLESGLATR